MEEEVLVGVEFWDLLGGKNTYDDLLKVFEEAGLELYDEIDKKMENLNNSSRKISDSHLHTQIRKKEVLPNSNQVDFTNDLDVLLAEIYRVLK